MTMNLNDAIQHCEEKAANSCGECAREHAQLAEWLKTLKSMVLFELDTDEFYVIKLPDGTYYNPMVGDPDGVNAVQTVMSAIHYCSYEVAQMIMEDESITGTILKIKSSFCAVSA